MKIIKTIIVLVIILIFNFLIYSSGTNEKKITTLSAGGNLSYYKLGTPQLLIKKGPENSFDSRKTHTFSIVEINKNNNRFWGYYTGWDGKNSKRDIGLAYSNNMTQWVKDGVEPVVRDLRWATVVVVDGKIHMFGDRNYTKDSYIVHLVSEDGREFKEVETVVAPTHGERHQNSFIFYDEKDKVYRLYYYHGTDNEYYLKEKHSKDINGIGSSSENVILIDNKYILAAPSMLYRDGKYWLTAETLRPVDKYSHWKTLVFVSDNPVKNFVPVTNHEILVDGACYFQYVFDNKLYGLYSYQYGREFWELYSRTHRFTDRIKIRTDIKSVDLSNKQTKKITAKFIAEDKSEDVSDYATWATSDNSIASVSKGIVTARSNGAAIITVSYGGVSTMVHVNVLK